MKKKNLKRLIALMMVGFGILYSSESCKKVEDEEPPADTTVVVLNEQSASNAALQGVIYTDIIANVLVSVDENDGSKGGGAKLCPTVSLTPTVGYPKTLTIDYGTGCTHFGHTKKGTITAVLTDNIKKKGSDISITFSSFMVDTLGINGTIKLHVDSMYYLTQTVDIQIQLLGFSFQTPGGTMSVDGNVHLLWFLNNLNDYDDDIIKCDSTSIMNAYNIKGKDYTFSVLDTLVYPVDCGTITQGILQVYDSNAPYPASVDFGDGSCDKKAEVCTKKELTIGSQTIYKDVCFDITIP